MLEGVVDVEVFITRSCVLCVRIRGGYVIGDIESDEFEELDHLPAGWCTSSGPKAHESGHMHSEGRALGMDTDTMNRTGSGPFQAEIP